MEQFRPLLLNNCDPVIALKEMTTHTVIKTMTLRPLHDTLLA